MPQNPYLEPAEDPEPWTPWGKHPELGRAARSQQARERVRVRADVIKTGEPSLWAEKENISPRGFVPGMGVFEDLMVGQPVSPKTLIEPLAEVAEMYLGGKGIEYGVPFAKRAAGIAGKKISNLPWESAGKTAGKVIRSERGSLGTGKLGKPVPDPRYSPLETTQNALADYEITRKKFEGVYGPDQTKWPGTDRNRLEVLRMVSEDAAKKVPPPETILGAAVKLKDGRIISATERKAGHQEAWNKLSKADKELVEDGSGWVTSRGRYISTPEAVKLMGSQETQELRGRVVPPAPSIPPTGQHLELLPEEYPQIFGVAMKQGERVYTGKPTHAEVMLDHGLDPGQTIPGFVTKAGEFVEQYPKAAKLENPSIPPIGQQLGSPPPAPVQAKRPWWHFPEDDPIYKPRGVQPPPFEPPPPNPYLEQGMSVAPMADIPPVTESTKTLTQALGKNKVKSAEGIDIIDTIRTMGGLSETDPSVDVNMFRKKETGPFGGNVLNKKQTRTIDEMREEILHKNKLNPNMETDDLMRLVEDQFETRKDIAEGNIIRRRQGKEEIPNLKKMTEEERETYYQKTMEDRADREIIDLEKEVADGSEGFRERRKAIEAIEDQEAFSPESEKELHDFFGAKGTPFSLTEGQEIPTAKAIVEGPSLSVTAKDQYKLPGMKQGLKMSDKGVEAEPTLEGSPLMEAAREAARKAEQEKVQPGLFKSRVTP
jgi:hypothetical protein